MKLENYINVSKSTFEDLKKLGNANNDYCFDENSWINDLLDECELVNNEWFIEQDNLIDFFKSSW